MANFCIFRAEKLRKVGSVAGALMHDLRAKETANADPEKQTQNVYMNGAGKVLPPKAQADREARKKAVREVLGDYRKLLPEKVKEDNVTCIQLFFGASPEVKTKPGFSWKDYFESCKAWAEEKFGPENVFFSATHYDETTPHMDLFVVPGYDFKYKDGHTERRLSAKKWLGGRKKMSELQDDFYEKVGLQHDLTRGKKNSKARHETIQKWYSRFNEFVDELDIGRQRDGETVDEYFERIKNHWNTYQENHRQFDNAVKNFKHEHAFYEQYHDNLPALKKYVADLEKRAQRGPQRASWGDFDRDR